MDEPRSSVQWDREVMASLLVTNVQLVADALRAGQDDSPGQVMRAVAATRSLDMIVDDTLRALGEQAGSAGHTWAEIGQLLHVSRQAAFQRFGGGHSPALEDEVKTPVDGAADAAVLVLKAFLDERFDEARATFGERMLDVCSVELLADVREKVRRY